MREESKLRDLLKRVRTLFRGKPQEPPEDPYAYVGAPKKPRPPYRRASTAAPLE